MRNIPTKRLFSELDSMWPTLIRQAPALAYKAAGCSMDIQLISDHEERFLRVVNGQLDGIKPGPRAMHRSDLSFSASESSWLEFWSPEPAPGFHDIFALSSFGHMCISGDIDTLLAHLGFIKELLGLPRGHLQSLLAQSS